VGNLTAGGSGKTPTVLRMVEQLSLRGLRPAVLTRGYRRRSADPVVISLPETPRSAVQLGDEAWLLQQRLEDVGLACPIGVGADRAAVGRRLLMEAEADIFILDDGLQHHRLIRDFNLVVVDVTQPLFFAAPLPLGRRREALTALGRAQAFLLSRTVPGCRYDDLKRRLRRYSPDAPVFHAAMVPVETRAADRISRRALRLDELVGKQVFAFCGLGAPEAFWRTLEDVGCRLAGRRAFPDHHRYSLDDWWRIAADARGCGAEIVLTSEKDLPNLEHEVPPEMRSGAPPLYALIAEQRIEDEQDLLDMIEEAAAKRTGPA
jgi:tetraacyldisaccharide 4'-kinase